MTTIWMVNKNVWHVSAGQAAVVAALVAANANNVLLVEFDQPDGNTVFVNPQHVTSVSHA